jgi:hypothetical protein
LPDLRVSASRDSAASHPAKRLSAALGHGVTGHDQQIICLEKLFERSELCVPQWARLVEDIQDLLKVRVMRTYKQC